MSEDKEQLLGEAMQLLLSITGVLEVMQVFENDVYEALPKEVKTFEGKAQALLTDYRKISLEHERLQKKGGQKNLF